MLFDVLCSFTCGSSFAFSVVVLVSGSLAGCPVYVRGTAPHLFVRAPLYGHGNMRIGRDFYLSFYFAIRNMPDRCIVLTSKIHATNVFSTEFCGIFFDE